MFVGVGSGGDKRLATSRFIPGVQLFDATLLHVFHFIGWRLETHAYTQRVLYGGTRCRMQRPHLDQHSMRGGTSLDSHQFDAPRSSPKSD